MVFQVGCSEDIQYISGWLFERSREIGIRSIDAKIRKLFSI